MQSTEISLHVSGNCLHIFNFRDGNVKFLQTRKSKYVLFPLSLYCLFCVMMHVFQGTKNLICKETEAAFCRRQQFHVILGEKCDQKPRKEEEDIVLSLNCYSLQINFYYSKNTNEYFVVEIHICVI